MSILSEFYGYDTTVLVGLDWGVYATNQTTQVNKGYLIDNSTSTHTVTLHSNPSVGDTVTIGDLNGNFHINNLTISRNSMLIQGLSEDLILNIKNQRVTLVYSGATNGWVITDLDPNNAQFEYMPYAVMHVQDEKVQGTAGGSSISGTQTRTLNIVKTNDISGASLSSNQITLPPGTYYIDAYAPNAGAGLNKLRLYNITTSSYVMEGLDAGSSTTSTISGFLVLSEQSVFELRHYTQTVVATSGLGAAISQGVEVYSGIKITKIGGNYAPRLINTDARLQMVAGLNYTDNVQGFDVTKTAANTLTVGVGACKDSTGLVDLYLTADTAVTIPTAANTLYHLFVCRLLAGTMTVKAYTSEAAAAADGTINAFRWIGYWMTNGSSNCKEGYIKEGILYWGKASENFIFALAAPPVGTNTAISLASFLPGASRVNSILFGAQSNITNKTANLGYDGTNCCAIVVGYNNFIGDTDSFAWGTGSTEYVPIVGTTVYWGDGTDAVVGNVALLLHSVKLRR